MRKRAVARQVASRIPGGRDKVTGRLGDEETIGHVISIRCDAGSSKWSGGGVGRAVAVRPWRSHSVVLIGKRLPRQVPGEGQAAERIAGVGDEQAITTR
jgi:hypothetical protein